MATIAQRPATRFALVAMLSTAILLNYVDRGAVGIAAPLMQRDLGLTATAFGVAVSAFFWIYAPVQLVLGWLCDRFCVYRLFALGVALWALSTTLTAFVPGLGALIMLRVMLGLGESIAFPASSKIIAAEVPAAQRGRANALIALAIAVGPAIGTLAGGHILEAYGWNAIFLTFGLITFLWLVPWSLVSRPYRRLSDEPRAIPYPITRLMRRPALWLMSLAHFCSNYPFYFLVAWLPLYLVKSRGLSIGTMTSIATMTFLAQGACALIAGWMSDRLVASGADEARLRRGLMMGGQFVVTLAIIGAAMAPSTGALAAWLLIAGAAGGVLSANIFTIAQMFAGPRATGAWCGVQNAFGNISGIVGPVATGVIIDSTGSYFAAFILTAAVSLVGALTWLFAMPRIEPIVEPA